MAEQTAMFSWRSQSWMKSGVLCAAILTAASALGQDYSCQPSAPKGYKSITIDASLEHPFVSDGALIFQYKNDDNVWIVVKNINPFVTKYTLSTKFTSVSEPALSAFFPLIGGIVGTLAKAPGAGTAAETLKFADLTKEIYIQPEAAGGGCSLSSDVALSHARAFQEHHRVLVQAIENATKEYRKYQTEYGNNTRKVQSAAQCPDIQLAGTSLRNFLDSVRTPDEASNQPILRLDSGDPVASLRDGIAALIVDGKNVQREILELRSAASERSGCSAIVTDSRLIDDIDYISRVIGPTTEVSGADEMITRVKQLANQFNSYLQAKGAVSQIYKSKNPFVLTMTITASQSDVELMLDKTPSDTSGQSDAKKTGPAQTAAGLGESSPPKAGGTDKAAAQSHDLDRTLHFGFGARFALGGGIVVSTLEKKEHTTANGQIAFSDHSSTRILPIALLHARVFDCTPKEASCIAKPYVSFGLTAKGDDKGVAPEFLTGLTWGIVGRQLFLTAGAYAGQQQRLLGGLNVGNSTTLSAANLPIAKEYHWNAGFAISWKIK